MDGAVWIYSESSGSRVAVVTRPQAGEVRLPAGIQLFEFLDESFRQSTRRVSKAHLDAFMASEPEEYTIRALLRFREQ
jgi:hypothetical protein